MGTSVVAEVAGPRRQVDVETSETAPLPLTGPVSYICSVHRFLRHGRKGSRNADRIRGPETHDRLWSQPPPLEHLSIMNAPGDGWLHKLIDHQARISSTVKLCGEIQGCLIGMFLCSRGLGISFGSGSRKTPNEVLLDGLGQNAAGTRSRSQPLPFYLWGSQAIPFYWELTRRRHALLLSN